jgi:pimeloyl-ACP methyl ester carboxylesterase
VADIYTSPSGRQAVEAQYRRVLERWPVAYEQLVVSTCQGDTFVLASGDRTAPPIVLLHGSGTNSASWMRDAPAWAQHYRVYAIDRPASSGKLSPVISGRTRIWMIRQDGTY